MGVVDHSANLGDRGLGDQAACNGVLRLTDGGALGDFIRKHGRAGHKRGIDLLLAFRVRAHAGNVGACGDLGVVQDGIKAGRD